MKKTLSTITAILEHDFSSKSFIREICFSLSRSLDEKNIYSIPVTIRKSVGELKDLLDPTDPEYDARSNSVTADKKLDFIRNMEEKSDLYQAALAESKVLYCELTGNEFKYTSTPTTESKPRTAADKKAMNALIKKYG